MIVTVTANPSVDRTIEVERPASRRRPASHAASRVDAGGKGVNVARALAANGHKSHGRAALRRRRGRQLTALLAEQRAGPGRGADRGRRSVPTSPSSSPTARPPSSTSRARRLTAAELLAIAEAAASPPSSADWVGGVRQPAAGRAGRLRTRSCSPRLQQEPGAGSRSTPAVRRCRPRSPAAPDLIKPNREELAEVSGPTGPNARRGTRAAVSRIRAARDRAPFSPASGADGAAAGRRQRLLARQRAGRRARAARSARATRLLAGFLAAGRPRPAGPRRSRRLGQRGGRPCPAAGCPARPTSTGDGVIVTDLTAGSGPPSLTRRLADLPEHAHHLDPGAVMTAAVITTDLVDLDLMAADRHDATRQLAATFVAAGRVTDLDGFLADVRRPRGADADRARGRHRHPARAVRARQRADARVRPQHRRASTSAPRTGRPT